jgi:hypothetical protein
LTALEVVVHLTPKLLMGYRQAFDRASLRFDVFIGFGAWERTN